MKLSGRIAVYARFSSDRQRDTSIEDQVRRCREYIERAGGRFNPDFVFADHAVSGASLSRPAFEKMMALVMSKPPAVDAIVTEDLSRMSRDFADAAMIFKRLQFVGVPLHGVGDGIDTSAKGAKLTFTMKSLVADIYLDDLRDKTLRGMEGRALAGHSTGGLPFGYRSVRVEDARGRVTGHEIEINQEQAEVVRWIFEQYLAGRSHAAIAGELHKRGVPPARAHTRHRIKGWVSSSVRVILHNEKYAGRWVFKKTQWVKEPGTNKRRSRLRPEEELLRRERPDLRIVDDATWQAVQARLSAVRTFYTKNPDGTPKGRAVPGRSTTYPFSSLLVCGECGGPMVIIRGSSASYYRCSHHTMRKTCSNGVSVREDLVRRLLLDAIRWRFSSPAGIAAVRKIIAEVLGEQWRQLSEKAKEHRERLARTEERIRGLVEFIATGDRSEYVVATLRDLEAQAKVEKATIAELERDAGAPVHLPTPDEVAKEMLELEDRVKHDPVQARELLRSILREGRIVLTPGKDRVYTARGALLPLALLQKTKRPSGVTGGAFYSKSSGGAIYARFTAISAVCEILLGS